MAATGRPSIYSPAVADEICSRLACGESLRSICRDEDAPHLPSIGTVIRWVTTNEEFREQYEEARKVQAETLADELVTIADGGGEDDSVKTARDRLRVDTRKWVASKILPKKYGEKLDLNHSGKVAVSHEAALDALGS